MAMSQDYIQNRTLEKVMASKFQKRPSDAEAELYAKNPDAPDLTKDQSQISYDEYKRRAILMGAAEDALATPDQYEEIKNHLAGSIARRKGMMTRIGEGISYAKDMIGGAQLPEYTDTKDFVAGMKGR